MNYLMNKFSKITYTGVVTLLLFLVPATVATGEQPAATKADGMALQLNGVVGSVDKQSREISLNIMGLVFTVFIPESLDLDDIRVGDEVKVQYFAAVEMESREPTAEELAEPWTVIEEGQLAEDGGTLGAEAARTVRAVVTVAFIDNAKELIAVKDSRDMTHFIMKVEPEKLDNLTVGQQIVVVFAEATAVALEKKS
jgi:hypothetical protein